VEGVELHITGTGGQLRATQRRHQKNTRTHTPKRGRYGRTHKRGLPLIPQVRRGWCERVKRGNHGEGENTPRPKKTPTLTTNVQKHGLGFNIAFLYQTCMGEKEQKNVTLVMDNQSKRVESPWKKQ